MQEANKKRLRILRHKNPNLSEEQCPMYKGTGSLRAAQHVRSQFGLVNQATKFSKNELTLDSPEMVRFTALLHEELKSSVPELLGNMDEMWRRQMRDDGLQSLHYNENNAVDFAEAKPCIRMETETLRSRASARPLPNCRRRVRLLLDAEFGSWVGLWHESAADCVTERQTV